MKYVISKEFSKCLLDKEYVVILQGKNDIWTMDGLPVSLLFIKELQKTLAWLTGKVKKYLRYADDSPGHSAKMAEKKEKLLDLLYGNSKVPVSPNIKKILDNKRSIAAAMLCGEVRSYSDFAWQVHFLGSEIIGTNGRVIGFFPVSSDISFLDNKSVNINDLKLFFKKNTTDINEIEINKTIKNIKVIQNEFEGTKIYKRSYTELKELFFQASIVEDDKTLKEEFQDIEVIPGTVIFYKSLEIFLKSYEKYNGKKSTLFMIFSNNSEKMIQIQGVGCRWFISAGKKGGVENGTN